MPIDVIKTEADRDAIVGSIKGPTGDPRYENFDALRAAFNASANSTNEWFSDLTNQIAQQFVNELLQVPLPIRRHHFAGEFVYGDYFRFYWSKLLNVKKYNPKAFTPKDLATDGHKLYQENIELKVPQWLQMSVGMVIDQKLVRAIFTEGTIPAFNAFINVVMENITTTLQLYLYNLEIKVLKQIKNTYKLTDYAKPAYITNNTQWKLAFIKKIKQQMTQPSTGQYVVLGKVNDQDPRTATSKKLTLADFVPRSLGNQQLICYTSPTQLTEFKTYAYATTFNPQELQADVTFESLNIDQPQPASGTEVTTPTGFLLAANVKTKAAADPSETAYLLTPNSLKILDRFRVTTTSMWVNNQMSQTISYFTTYALMWLNLGCKLDLRTS